MMLVTTISVLAFRIFRVAVPTDVMPIGSAEIANSLSIPVVPEA